MRVARAAIASLVLLLFAGSSVVLGGQGAPQPVQRWIVQLRPGVSVPQVASATRDEFGQPALQRFTHVLNGFAVSLTDAQRERLAADPRVLAVVPDRPIYAADYPHNDYEIQPGVERVGATMNTDRSAGGLDVDIAVLDTGIQADNPDLNIAGGYDCTDSSTQPDWTDTNANFGHGTHVAGIAAAIQNQAGVAGVAQGARLWSIKVLDASGNGYWSWVICGLDQVAQMTDPDGTPKIEVVNMSLAGPGSDDGDCGYSNDDLLHQAVCHLANDVGVTMVVAAGNESRDASDDIPAAYDEVITVAAMSDWVGQQTPTGAPSSPPGCGWADANNTFASFSNYGADVDLIAPGECVWSTAPNTKLKMMSGTSMATPHVTGGAALYYVEEARLGRPRPTPQQVRAALVASGTSDWDGPDPGNNFEPALNVSDAAFASITPAFRIGTMRQVVRVRAGSSDMDKAWIAGIGGFNSLVDLSVDTADLPPGVDATFDSPQASASNTPSLLIQVAADTAPGSYTVSVAGTFGDETEHGSVTLIVYNTVVDAGGPVITFTAGVQSKQGALPVLVRWSVVSHATRYRVEVSIDEGPWSAPTKTTSAKLTTTAWPGRRYQYRVQAKVHGTWQSAWQTGPSSVVNAIEPSTLSVTPSDSWVSAPSNNAYSEEPIYSTSPDSTASYDFTGTGIAWMAITGPSKGKAVATLDGVKTTVNLYSRSIRNRVLVFGASQLANGEHTLTITVLGRPTGHPRVDIDCLLVVAN